MAFKICNNNRKKKGLKIFVKEVGHILYRTKFCNSKENGLGYIDFQRSKEKSNKYTLPPATLKILTSCHF